MPELYSTNSVGLHFREVVEKIKKAAKKKKEKENREPKWAGNIWREKLAYVDIWGKTSKIL